MSHEVLIGNQKTKHFYFIFCKFRQKWASEGQCWLVLDAETKGGDSRAREEIHLAIYEFNVGS